MLISLLKVNFFLQRTWTCHPRLVLDIYLIDLNRMKSYFFGCRVMSNLEVSIVYVASLEAYWEGKRHCMYYENSQNHIGKYVDYFLKVQKR